MWVRHVALAGLLALGLTGCHKADHERSTQERRAAEPQAIAVASSVGAATLTAPRVITEASTEVWYRMTFSRPQCTAAPILCEVPVLLSLRADRDGDKVVETAFVVTADLRYQADVIRQGLRLDIVFPRDLGKIHVDEGADGVLRGRWVAESLAFGVAALDVVATRFAVGEPRTRFAPTPAEPPLAVRPEPQGTWSIDLDDAGLAKLEIEVIADRTLTAVIEFQSGGTEVLAGELSGRTARLTGFDGATPLALVVDIEGDALRGHWVAGQAIDWYAPLTGARQDGYELPRVVATTTTAPLRLAELNAPQYQGRPVIVEFGASWCHSCLASVPVLRELYERHHAAGLQILSLDYELTEDSAFNAARAAQFKADNSIPWEVRAVDGTVEDYWSIIPGEALGLAISSLPVAVFLDADHVIRSVHVGFPGPEAGDAHARVRAQFAQLAAAITATAATPQQPQP